MAMLLVEPVDTNADQIGDEIRDTKDLRDPAGVRQMFIRRTTRLDNVPASLSPLVQNIRSSETNSNDQWAIQWSRYDLANTDIEQFKPILSNFVAWFDTQPPSTVTWFDRMSNWRFQGDPLPLKPLTADNIARTTPVFIEHCSQFIVEFAGDFLIQDPLTGTIVDYRADEIAQEGDGIDFIIDNSSGSPVRRIRWYGMPRDVASPTGGPDGIIRGFGPANELVDVLPLRDVLGGIPPVPQFIERVFPSPAPPNNYVSGAGSMSAGSRYIVAWGPDTDRQPKPSMIRIVYTIDDPAGRVADGQTFEYVFRIGG
jgi:hypothetical protein